MTQADSDGCCPVCQAPITETQVFVRAAEARLHVECFFTLKAEGKLPKPPVSRARGAS